MTWRATLVFFLIFSGGAVGAETVRITSGEHDTFSRLVVPIPKDARWSLRRAKRSAILEISNADLVIDATDVFRRIPRTRLVDLHQESAGSPLVLELGCSCQVTAADQNGAYLVIDIADERVTGSSGAAMALPKNLLPYRFPETAKKPADLGKVPARRRKAPGKGISSYGALTLPPSDDIPSLIAGKRQLRFWENRLADQIRKAAGRGLLAMSAASRNGHERKTDGRPSKVADKAEITAKTEEVDILRTVPGFPDRSTRNLVISTAATQKPSGRPDVQASVDKKDLCLSGPIIDIPSWARADSFSEQLGKSRRQLFSDLDRTSPAEALDLAKTYLFWGFGAEAKSALSLVKTPQKDWSVYRALASVMDGDHQEEGVFFSQASCSGDVAMWAVLSAPIGAREVDANAVQRGFARLPKHLRRDLGPRLAARFAASGDGETAAAILRAVKRIGQEPGVLEMTVEADLADLHNDPATAVRRREQALKNGSEGAAQAVVDLVDASWRGRRPVAPELPDIAASYALEYRNSKLGKKLRRAHVISLALTGRFDDAMKGLSELGSPNTTSGDNDTLVPVLTLLTEAADDITFLRYILPVVDTPPEGLSADIVESGAKRLLDLGMTTSAEAFLANEIGTASDTKRLILAEIALKSGRPQRALRDLLGLSSSQAVSLKASALMQFGEPAKAAVLYRAASDTPNAMRSLWLSGETDTPQLEGDGEYARLLQATRNLGAIPNGSKTLPPLASAEAKLADSIKTRAEVEDLLKVAGQTH